MQKTKLLLLSAASLLALASCGNNNTPSEQSKSDSSQASSHEESKGSSAQDSTTDSSEGSLPPAPMSIIERALRYDYDHTSAFAGELPGDMGSQLSEYFYFIDGYTVVYDVDLAEMGYPTPYYFFHEYEGEKYMWFNGNASQGEVSGWLNRGYRDAPVTLPYQYMDPLGAMEYLADYADDFSYLLGLYLVTDEALVQDVLDAYFPHISTEVDTIAFDVDTDEKRVTRMRLFDADIDTDANITEIQFGNFGTTTRSAVPSSVPFPEEPNEDNTLAYWEYKGHHGPDVTLYPVEATLAAIDATPDAQGTFALEIEKELLVRASATFGDIPEGVYEDQLIYNNGIKYVIEDPTVLEESYAMGTDGNYHKSLKALAAGETDVYFLCNSAEGEGKGVSSNKIHVKVVELKEISLVDAIANLTWRSINGIDLVFENAESELGTVTFHTEDFNSGTLSWTGSQGVAAGSAEFVPETEGYRQSAKFISRGSNMTWTSADGKATFVIKDTSKWADPEQTHFSFSAELRLSGTLTEGGTEYVNETFAHSEAKSGAKLRVRNTIKTEDALTPTIYGNEAITTNFGNNAGEVWDDVTALIMRPCYSDTLNTTEACNALLTFDFGTAATTGIAFYYGEYYGYSGVKANFDSAVESVLIETSLDGETWDAIDITNQVKSNISSENFKLIEESFGEAVRYVRLRVNGNGIKGSVPALALPGVTFYK